MPDPSRRLRKRFPLVLLDEAQDTNGSSSHCLTACLATASLFKSWGTRTRRSMRMRIWRQTITGVQTTTLLVSMNRGASELKLPGSPVGLTVRAQQQILGLQDVPNRHTLILFCPNTILAVLPTYVDEVRTHWGDALTSDLDIRAVASRHNPTTDNSGERPKTLVEYYPDYRSGRGRQSRANTLCASLRQAALLHQANAAPSEVVELFTTGLVGLLRRQGWQNALGQTVDGRNLWRILAARKDGLALQTRRLLRDRIAAGNAPWNHNAWNSFRDDLIAILGINGAVTRAATTYLEFIATGAVEEDGLVPRPSSTSFKRDDVAVRLGSIHSVKGKTVDALLVVETEVWRGRALATRAMDLATVLPHTFGLENRDFSANIAHLAAATNIFVAATRPRQLLACALRKAAVTDDLLNAAHERGWHVRDLTATLA